MHIKKTFILLSVCVLAISTFIECWIVTPAHTVLRYQPTGFNSHFLTETSASFTHYIEVTTAAIRNARRQAEVDDTPRTLSGNAPTQWLPDPHCKKNAANKYENGVLLIHGLLDSPYSMHVLAEHFHSKCFIVYTLLLPGHGTVPGDLLQVQFQDWLAASELGVNNLSKMATHLYIVGYSLGGLIAINQALKTPNQIKGLILYAPVLKINTHLVPLISPLYWLSRLIPALRWWAYHDDTNPVRYESLPLNSIYQVQQLIELVQAKLHIYKISLPLFIVESAEDGTVSASATLAFFANNTNPQSKLLWYSQTNRPLADTRAQVIMSALPSEHILNFAHTSLFLPANDAMYGKHGKYKDCLHYPERSANWVQCKKGENTFLGEITPETLKNHCMQRLTYNPFFDSMLQALDKYLESQ
jgi:esterase/lipase